MILLYRYLAWAFVGVCLLIAVGVKAYILGNDYGMTKYYSLRDSYSQAALKATQDATAQEARDRTNLAQQSATAIQRAQTAQTEAERQKGIYLAKLKADAGMKDLGHVCGGVVIPQDLRP